MSIVLRDPRTEQFTSYAKFIAREQRRQAVYAEACAMTPVDVEVKRAPVVAGPVCRWSDPTMAAYASHGRQRAINWTSV